MPRRVWERLTNDEPLTLVADGEAKAIVIPVQDGDVAAALDAYRRGQAMISLRQIRERARKSGASKMTLAEINEVVRDVRAERRNTPKSSPAPGSRLCPTISTGF